jgi:hypothetical protein
MSLYSMLSMFGRIPKVGRYLLPVFILMPLLFLVWMFLGRAWFVACLIAVLAGLAGLFLIKWLRKRREKQKAAAFGKDLLADGEEVPKGLSREEHRARLGEIREKFKEGLQRFKESGKDLYTLPWYLVLGEPGAGKTEAIRHSGITFPPGLHDELMGAGGTLNMNWWFSSEAVLLDLAGRLVFDELEPGNSLQWEEFLKLLLTSRPDCPVNGLLLVIPADSLLQDDEETIKRKAGLLAHQLEFVQRSLDIRFPAHIMVTKCDLIPGFKESFEHLSAEEQQQIFGWSNPSSIDDAFDPETSEDVLTSIQTRLRSLRTDRLAVMGPLQDFSSSRLDETDALYDLPANFGLVCDSLKPYLSVIFTANEWMLKPLFLRGVFFSSAMQEGAALDKPLVETFGLDVETLRPDRPWELNRSRFLRDFFRHKMFREWGLVTRATHASRRYLRRRATVMAGGIAAAVILLVMTFFGGYSLNKLIIHELDMWRLPARALGTDGTLGAWPAIVSPADTPCTYSYNGTIRLRTEEGRRLTLGNYYPYMQQVVSSPLRTPFVFRMFRPFGRSIDRERRSALSLLFEKAVVQPVANAAAEKLQLSGEDVPFSNAELTVLNELVRVQAEHLNLAGGVGDLRPTMQDEVAGKDPEAAEPEEGGLMIPVLQKGRDRLDLDAFFAYVLRPSSIDCRDYLKQHGDYFQDVLRWTYKVGNGGGRDWPPAWLAVDERLADVPSLDHGLQRFLQDCESVPEVRLLLKQLEQISLAWPRLRVIPETTEPIYQDIETEFFSFLQKNLNRMSSVGGLQGAIGQWFSLYEALERDRAVLSRDFSMVKAAVDDIAFLQSTNLVASYAGAVSNALAAVRSAQGRLAVPLAPKALVASLIEEADSDIAADGADTVALGKDPNLIDEIRAEMDRSRVLLGDTLGQDDLPEQLATFRQVYTNLAHRVDTYDKRVPACSPVDFPNALGSQPATWSQAVSEFRRTQVSLVHEDLEYLCHEVQETASQFAGLSIPLPTQDVARLDRMAGQGLERVGERNFKRECDKVVESWAKLKGHVPSDRRTLLLLSDQEFIQQYLLNVSAPELDFVGRYWQDKTHRALTLLSDEASATCQETIVELRKYARYPLDQPRPGVPELSPDEFLKAAELFAQLEIIPVHKDPETLGAGLALGVSPWAEEIERLRTLGLGLEMDWFMKSQALLRALGGNGPGTCTIELLSKGEQTKNRRKHRSAHWQWSLMSVVRGGASHEKQFRTLQQETTRLATVLLPGEPFEIRFYKYFSNRMPDAVISGRSPWAILDLMHKYKTVAADEDGKAWDVELVVKGRNKKHYSQWIRLTFEDVMPSKEDWPVLTRNKERFP